ncbi:hypothetical protein HMI54_012144, partial [Coelomomyces lativittatus]
MAGVDLESYPFFAFDGLVDQIPPAPAIPTPMQQLVHDDSLDRSDERSNGSEEDDAENDALRSSDKARSNSAAAKKVRAACSNCRASHVACSHEVPCRRCVEHGIGDTCKYLPRKKRTNFKKRKQGDGKEDVEETSYSDNSRQPLPPVSSATSYNPLSSCDKPTTATATSSQSAFPNMFETGGLRQGGQDPSLLPFTQLLGDFPSSLSLLGATNSITPSSINSSIQLLENILSESSSNTSPSTVPDMDEPSSWLSHVISDSEPLASLGSSSSP